MTTEPTGRLVMTVYPQLHEAIVRPRPSGPAPGAVRVTNKERARAEAIRRARRELERVMLANGLVELATLTYEAPGCFSIGQVAADVAAAMRSYRSIVGENVAYAVTRELHPGGHGWHVMVAMSRVDADAMGAAWPNGAVFHDPDRRQGLVDDHGRDGAIRMLAGYMAKDFEQLPPGTTRYTASRGSRARRITIFGDSLADLLDRASVIMGRRHEKVRSDAFGYGTIVIW